jgi:delta 1-pyrroline-5-carboxylate dehydrogenase
LTSQASLFKSSKASLFKSSKASLFEVDKASYSQSLTFMEIANFINGGYSTTKTHLDSVNPSNGTIIAKIPNSGVADVDLAVKAASDAFTSWSATSCQYRSSVLLKIALILESRLEEFALAESQDQGKPLTLARLVDVPRAIYNFRFFASSILYDDDRCTQYAGLLNYTRKEPVGVVALISPWNLPLYLCNCLLFSNLENRPVYCLWLHCCLQTVRAYQRYCVHVMQRV